MSATELTRRVLFEKHWEAIHTLVGMVPNASDRAEHGYTDRDMSHAWSWFCDGCDSQLEMLNLSEDVPA